MPLRDVVSRLEELFGQAVFVDRRVDPSQKVNLDFEISRLEQALTLVATYCGLGVGRVGGFFYLGPPAAAEQIASLAALREEEIARLPASERAALEGAEPLHWQRLTEPRQLVAKLVRRHGWRLAQAERIPHDLLPAGELLPLNWAEQLTILLIGFDLTFELQPEGRELKIVPIRYEDLEPLATGPSQEHSTAELPSRRTPMPRRPSKTSTKTRQVYSLRVAEQPVRKVLLEFERRLNWDIEIEEDAISAAGRSADTRVSFAVENVGQDELLEALLQPAGLTFRREGETIRIVPGRSK